MNAAYPGNYYPPNVGLAIHGHVHDFQAINFASNHPATLSPATAATTWTSRSPRTTGCSHRLEHDLPAVGT